MLKNTEYSIQNIACCCTLEPLTYITDRYDLQNRFVLRHPANAACRW